MWDPASFASEMLRALSTEDPGASSLQARTRGKKATIGIVDADEWVPLLRLSNPSASCDVMNLDVRQGRGWAPTFERGTPEALAQHLRGPLRFTWAVEVEASGWSETSGHVH